MKKVLLGSVDISSRPNKRRGKKDKIQIVFSPFIKTRKDTIEEIAPPTDEKAIHWLLLTSLPIDNFEDSVKYLKWYAYHWLIERYHYVLKSGCGLEKLQLDCTIRRLFSKERRWRTRVKVIWRGLKRLKDITDTWLLCNSLPL